MLAGPDGKLYYMHANTAELVALEPDLPVRDEYFERWEQSSPNDQSTTDTDPDTPGKQPAHSGLAGAPGAEGVRDNQLADAARAAVKGGAKFVWAFGQCFGAGFFDELNALGGTQAMSSAAQHYQVSRYPEPPADGNGIDWIKAYLKALVAGGSVALPLADASARNDPWGPNPTPDPPRVNETGGSEQPVYHETIPAAGAIDLADGGDERFAVIWAGGALRQIDVEEVIDAVDRLIVGLGFARDRIFVFIDDGRISAEHPLSRLPARQIRKPNRIGLENLFTQLNAVRNRCKLPPLVLFLAVGHGFNTDPRCGGDRPRDGGGSYEPADGLDGDYGSGDDLSYGDIEPWCPREDSSNEPALPQGIRRW
ncbi:MAG: hypothetical protein CHACPFDD_01885 [Phycisphaerae bacterium]|nr:hypothetical protein [Phycisphaerae bacterium]